MSEADKTAPKPIAPDAVLHGNGLSDGPPPGDKRHYWGMLHALLDSLVRQVADPQAQANDSETHRIKIVLADWTKALFSNEAGKFARQDVDELLKAKGVEGGLDALWAWRKAHPNISSNPGRRPA